MRGVKAKRLRRAAAKWVVEHRQRTNAMFCPVGGGVLHYLWGWRRTYKDMKAAVKRG